MTIKGWPPVNLVMRFWNLSYRAPAELQREIKENTVGSIKEITVGSVQELLHKFLCAESTLQERERRIKESGS